MTPDHGLEVIEWGAGDSVLLVHGSLAAGPATWSRQRPLSASWGLRVVQRRGFGASPPADAEDFEVDAADLIALLDEPAHVVGHSYGAIGALLAAARRPDRVRSLTLIEPTCVAAAADDPVIAAGVAAIDQWWREAPEDPAEFLSGYGALLGIKVPSIERDPAAAAAAGMLRRCRRPWTAEIPWEALQEAGIPTLAVSGGHSPPLDTITAAVARRSGGEHRVLSGAGHAVQRTGEPFNAMLEAHLLAQRSRA
jgi:pimeloyl-ACP methyl ester carboxylesterase